jgi:hypothetical protein
MVGADALAGAEPTGEAVAGDDAATTGCGGCAAGLTALGSTAVTRSRPLPELL